MKSVNLLRGGDGEDQLNNEFILFRYSVRCNHYIICGRKILQHFQFTNLVVDNNIETIVGRS